MKVEDNAVIEVAGLTFNHNTLEVHRQGKHITLTAIALKILEPLMRHSSNVVTRQAIEKAVWQDSPPDGAQKGLQSTYGNGESV